MNEKLEWKISHDPLGLCVESSSEVRSLEHEAKLQGEDLLQFVLGDEVIDVGWYQDRFKILFIEAKNWENPIEESDFDNLTDLLKGLKEKYGLFSS